MKPNNKYIKAAVFIGLVLVIFLLDRSYGWSRLLADPRNLPALREALAENRFKAMLLYSGLTIIGCVVLALPGVVFAIAAGVLFGPLWGTIACSIATTIGASLAFLASRYFLHDAIRPLVMKNRHIRRLFFEGNRRNALMLLMITRLVPIFPYNLQNFAYGITDISFGAFTLYSLIFMLPGTAAYVIAASGLTDATHRLPYLLLAAGLLAFVLMVSARLRKLQPDEPGDNGTPAAPDRPSDQSP